MPKVHRRRFAIVRPWEPGTVAAVTADTDKPMSPNEVRAAVGRAVTDWIMESELGRVAWANSCRDFNIGDLSVALKTDTIWLPNALKAHGILFLSVDVVESVYGGHLWEFDDVLPDEGEIEEQQELASSAAK